MSSLEYALGLLVVLVIAAAVLTLTPLGGLL